MFVRVCGVRLCMCICVSARGVCTQKNYFKELYKDPHGPEGTLKEIYFKFNNDNKNRKNQEF